MREALKQTQIDTTARRNVDQHNEHVERTQNGTAKEPSSRRTYILHSADGEIRAVKVHRPKGTFRQPTLRQLSPILK
jgi:hypothetical protein